MGMHSLFPLTETELRAVIKKKKGAPKGKLRQFYDVRNNRELITKVARELYYMILWDVLHGCRFYFPGTRKTFIHVDYLPDYYFQAKRRAGFYYRLDVSVWDYKLPVLRVRCAKSNREHDSMISLSGAFFATICKYWYAGEKIGGKKPRMLKHYLPDLSERFAYLREDSLNYIVDTFLQNYKLAVEGGAKITIADEANWMLTHPLELSDYRLYYNMWRKKEVQKKIISEKNKKLAKEQKEIYKDVAIS